MWVSIFFQLVICLFVCIFEKVRFSCLNSFSFLTLSLIFNDVSWFCLFFVLFFNNKYKINSIKSANVFFFYFVDLNVIKIKFNSNKLRERTKKNVWSIYSFNYISSLTKKINIKHFFFINEKEIFFSRNKKRKKFQRKNENWRKKKDEKIAISNFLLLLLFFVEVN